MGERFSEFNPARRTWELAEISAREGARQVVLPVLAATATTAIVLVPFLFLQGDLRVYYLPLAFAVGFSIIASLFVAFSFVPTMTARFARTVKAAPVATEAPDSGPAPIAIARLDNGLPATFVAVTKGWEAVEVDTATGNIIRSFGATQRPDESDDEAAVTSAIQQVWRTSDQQTFILSTCCEPAAGELFAVGLRSSSRFLLANVHIRVTVK